MLRVKDFIPVDTLVHQYWMNLWWADYSWQHLVQNTLAELVALNHWIEPLIWPLVELVVYWNSEDAGWSTDPTSYFHPVWANTYEELLPNTHKGVLVYEGFWGEKPCGLLFKKWVFKALSDLWWLIKNPDGFLQKSIWLLRFVWTENGSSENQNWFFGGIGRLVCNHNVV